MRINGNNLITSKSKLKVRKINKTRKQGRPNRNVNSHNPGRNRELGDNK